MKVCKQSKGWKDAANNRKIKIKQQKKYQYSLYYYYYNFYIKWGQELSPWEHHRADF